MTQAAEAPGAVFRVREGRETDLGLVYDSWAQSFYDAPAVRGAPRGLYFAGMRPRIRRLLERGRLLVACDIADEDTLLGWACCEDTAPGVLHYVFVRKDVRGGGVARALIEAAGDIGAYSHKSRGVSRVPDGWIYDPFAAEG